MIHYIKEWYNRNFADPQMAFLLVFFAGTFALLYFFGEILLPVGVAVVLAYLLEAPVAWLEHRGIPRFAGFLIIFILFLSGVAASLLAVAPLVIKQFSELVLDTPRLVSALQQTILSLTEKYPDLFSSAQLGELFESLQSDLGKIGQKVLAASVSSVKGLFNVILYLIMIPLLVFFFLKDKVKIKTWLSGFMSRDSLLLKGVVKDVDLQLGKYIRGKFWEMIIVWITSTVTFYILDLPYSVFNGLLVGVSVLIPYVGALMAFFPIAIIGFVHFGPGSEYVIVLVAYLVIQFIDGNLLAPLFFAEVVDLHPIAILVSIIFFGGIWGVWGVFFAIPLATLINTVLLAQREISREKRETT